MGQPTADVGFDPGRYGRDWAADYDRLYETREDVAPVVDVVRRYAGQGRVLEFGVGSGRLAVPLAQAGLAVTGVDASPEMLTLLKERADGHTVEAVHGSFTDVALSGTFDVVLIAFSTIFLVPTQEAQLECLANARRHLGEGGVVIVEAFVPDHSRWARGQNVSISELDSGRAVLKLSTHDPVNQTIQTGDIIVEEGRIAMRPNVLRYAWPAELDAMALVHGLRLVQRWADWQGTPFGAGSGSHVSVYQA